MQPFLALITPVGGDGGGGGGGGGGHPSHPIYYPPGIWGGGGVGNYPDAGFTGPQPGQPPRPWGPINYPDQGLPGQQPVPGRPAHPIHYPPVIWDPSRPTNPIVNPGDPNNPGDGQGDRTPKIEWKTAW